MIVLVGGATGTGKSTVATEVAYRLGIRRVTSTDFVRETMRAFLSREFMPSIHYSSFEVPGDNGVGGIVEGFVAQTRNVVVGVKALIERALQEGWSLVLEGVHLVPGMIPRVEGAMVVHCVLAIEPEELHESHFLVRDATSGGLRPVDKYIDTIRRHPADPGLHRRPGTPVGGASGREHQHRSGGAERDRARLRAGRAHAPRGGLMATGERVEAAVAGSDGAAVRYCLCESYARATERAALAGARWLGRADQESAEDAAFSGMEAALSDLPITGRVVIGGGDVGVGSSIAGPIGAGGEEVDLALDPLEGRGVVARGGNGAISMIVVGEPGKLRTLPDMYMRSMAVGPRARGQISLEKPVAENIRAIADAFGRNVGDITTIVLDRVRHHDLIEEIRAAGARIKLIQDGTVTASVRRRSAARTTTSRSGSAGRARRSSPPARCGASAARSRRSSGRPRAERSRRRWSTGSTTSSRCSRPRTSPPAR